LFYGAQGRSGERRGVSPPVETPEEELNRQDAKSAKRTQREKTERKDREKEEKARGRIVLGACSASLFSLLSLFFLSSCLGALGDLAVNLPSSWADAARTVCQTTP
jgi:hypothetical protein